MQRIVWGLASVVVLAGTWAGCSAGGTGVGAGATAGTGAGGSSGDGSSSGGTSAGGTASGGTAGGGFGGASGSGSGGTAASGSGGAEDAGLPDVVFSYDAPSGEAEACAAVSVGAQLVPLDLYIVLDRSGSMVNSALGPLRWPPVRDALNAFFQSPQAAGIGIALTMFAHPTLTSCSAASYVNPLVPMAALPGNATGQALTLQTTMNQYAPVLGVGTPTESASTGAVTFAKNWKTSHPSHTVAIVLATDGLPGDASCSGEDAAGTQAAIAAGYNGTPSIRTYVIGIDPDTTMQTNLSNWANAGGGQFFDVGTSGGSSQFLQAMKNIQGSLLGCTFSMPVTDAGIIQPDKVVVVFTSGAGSPTPLPRVQDKGSCSGPGWYYDNNANPSTIELCAGSCTTVQADPAGKINIELGCLGS